MSVAATTLAVMPPSQAIYTPTLESTRVPAVEPAAAKTNAEASDALPSDVLDISPQSMRLAANREASKPTKSTSVTNGATSDGKTPEAELSEEEQAQVDELKQRDREVRTHEQAHKSVAGPYAVGGPTYEYQRGPDGQNYAIGGSVDIDTSPVKGDPEATIEKMQVVQAAALAPAEPSSQDRKVAAAAARQKAEAQADLIAARFDDSSEDPDQSSAGTSVGDVSKPAIAAAYETQQQTAQQIGDLINQIA